MAASLTMGLMLSKLEELGLQCSRDRLSSGAPTDWDEPFNDGRKNQGELDHCSSFTHVKDAFGNQPRDCTHDMFP